MRNNGKRWLSQVVSSCLVALAGSGLFAATCEVGGITWNYEVVDDAAVLVGTGNTTSAIPTDTIGAITVPTKLDGYPVRSIGNYAFYECIGLTSATIPTNVTSIGEYAFSGCIGLSSMKIPSSVTNVACGAFSGCREMTSVSIPSSLKLIANNTFYGCSSLKSVTIPTSVTRLGNDSFFGCSSLTSMTIPSSVTYLGSSVFASCSGLKSVTIPSSVGEITRYAFCECVSLTSVKIPSGVVNIGNDAFYGCRAMTSVTIPEGVRNIGSSAFYGCGALTSAPLPSSVVGIGSYAFSGCSGLKSMKIPDNVASIGNYAFSGCTGLTRMEFPPSVTSIGQSAFSGCSGLTFVKIPASVQDIGSFAFDGCYSIKEAIVPGWQCEIDFSSVTKLELSEGVKNIGVSAFSDCDSMKSVKIPSTVTNIGDYAFSGCRGLTEVKIPSSVVSIGVCAFDGCDGMKSVTIPSSVTSLGRSAFTGCAGLKSVEIPSSVTSIGSSVFAGCSGLASVTIPDGVTSIGGYAFYDCSGLKSVAIPSSVTSIGSYAFAGCTGLTSVTIPPDVTSIGSSAFAGCTGLTTATISDGVTGLGSSMFSGCTGLTTVEIPSSVTSIGNDAFNGSGVTSVIIPSSVTDIGGGAFGNCDNLTTIYVADGDRERIEELLEGSGSGFDPESTKFVECDLGAEVVVSFDAAGGDPAPRSRTVKCGQPVGALPAVKRQEFAFGGWFTAATGGTQVTAKTIVTGAMTCYAHWVESEGPIEEPLTAEGEVDPMHPAYVSPELFMLKAQDVFAGDATFNGWVREGGNIAGTLSIKARKAGKDGSSKLTVRYAPLGGKKKTIKLAKDAMPQVGGNPVVELPGLGKVKFGADSLAGVDIDVQAGPDLARSKDKAAKAAYTAKLAGRAGVWTFAFNTAVGYAAFSVTVDKKGKGRLTGTLPDGTKVSLSSQGTLGDQGLAIPFMYSRKASFGFVFWVYHDGMTALSDATPIKSAAGSAWGINSWTQPSAAHALRNGNATLRFGEITQDFTVAGRKWIFPKPQKKLGADDPNPYGTKLSFNEKTGVVKGSFSLPNAEGKAVKFTVNGVVVDGKFHGSASAKGASPIKVTAE